MTSMFTSSKRFEPPKTQSFSTKSSTSRSHKPAKSSSSFREGGVTKRRHESSSRRRPTTSSSHRDHESPSSPIVTLVVGRDQRVFAAHEHILAQSPFFQAALLQSPGAGSTTGAGIDSPPKRIYLNDEEPEIFSCVLEFLYKGDYTPRLVHNKRRNSWELSEEADSGVSSTIFRHPVDGELLKDTVVYCTAERYGLEELKKISLKKQGLQSGIQCSTILSSARYAYANTPDTDSKLRAHYLALIIRSRATFKRSGTMQLEMFNGQTQLFFDLFVSLCNHVDDLSSAASTPRSTPRTNRFF